MLKLVIFSFLYLCVHLTSAQKECPIAYHCNDTFINLDNKVGVYCNESQERTMIGRCCTKNNTIIGLDLRYCEIKKLKIPPANFSDLDILDLRDNDFEKFTGANLVGLLKLDLLYLSSHIPCPGGIAAWRSISVDNETTICAHQLDLCKSLNISCGELQNAQCHHLGPGSAKCLCSPGYFGYKCLNEGVFPTAVFCTSVIIPGVALSIILWFVQGRDPYKKIRIEE